MAARVFDPSVVETYVAAMPHDLVTVLVKVVGHGDKRSPLTWTAAR
jgi:hypothetical protein